MSAYRGRIAPTPTGFLHLGHAATFLVAHERARAARGTLVFRMDDLDATRCRAVFAHAALEDLSWLGLSWQEGPGCSPAIEGPFAPYHQSQRTALYLNAWHQLKEAGLIYPCHVSRQDMRNAPLAPHEPSPDCPPEPVFPKEWRPPQGTGCDASSPAGANWRFRVPDGRVVAFHDALCGPFSAVAGVDFGDFPVWRRDGVPAYELAVVVDDAAMQITEVVRGRDLLLSTCRQLLLYEALGITPPAFAHTPLLRDKSGRRLAKRTAALALRSLQQQGLSPRQVRQMAFAELEKAGLPAAQLTASLPVGGVRHTLPQRG